jgi:hypothetical protein
MNQQLTIGRIVHVYVDPRSNNGADTCPAILTRVWGSGEMTHSPVCSVNMRLLLDHPSNDPATNEWRTSAQVFASREHAEQYLTTGGGGAYVPPGGDAEAAADEWIKGRKASGMVAFMPPRV